VKLKPVRNGGSGGLKNISVSTRRPLSMGAPGGDCLHCLPQLRHWRRVVILTAVDAEVLQKNLSFCCLSDLKHRGGATPGPGRSYALPLKNWDLALGPACENLIKYTVRQYNHSLMIVLKFLYSFKLDFFCILLFKFSFSFLFTRGSMLSMLKRV